MSLLQFQKIAKLGPLLDLFLGDGFGSAAVVTFDSQPELVQDFTSKTGAISQQLKNLQPGDGGGAILDAVRFSVDMLEQQPPDRRRILLLISESRDHGSKKTQAKDLIERIGTSNTLVLSLTYSAAGSEFLNDLKGGGGCRADDEPDVPVADGDCSSPQKCGEAAGSDERWRIRAVRSRKRL